MNRRSLWGFIAINAVVSAGVTLLILSLWEARRSAPAPSATSLAQPASTRPPAPSAPPSTNQPAAPSSLSAPTASPMPTGPFVYVIESGDTLGSLSLKFDVPLADLLAANNLTEDAILSVGQEITIPIGGSTTSAPATSAPATSDATPAATSGPALVTIREIEAPGSLDAETVILTNLGELINLRGWTLSDGGENRYTFPDVTIFASAEINLHTGAGANTPSELYWGQDEARWGQRGTVAYLRDAAGRLVATYRVP